MKLRLKMTKEQASQRIAEITASIGSLVDEKCELERFLIQEEKINNRKRFEAWGLQNNSCLICFAKYEDHHWCMVKTIYITDINEEYQRINTFTGDYREDDYQCSFRVEEQLITFAHLEELENNFNIYMVDEVQLALIQQAMCNLKIEYSNLRQYEDTFAKQAFLSVKVNN